MSDTDFLYIASLEKRLEALEEENNRLKELLKNAVEDVEAEPMKYGYWEEITDYGGWGDIHYRCSVCGEEWYLEDGKPKDKNMNFCPRCSARMDLNSRKE